VPVRDLSIFLLLAAFAGAALYRPWLGVLGLAVVAYMSPHVYGKVMATFPAYLLVFAATTVSVLLRRQWHGLFWDWRLGLLLLLWAWFLVTTLQSMAPYAAWPRFAEVSKSLIPLLFTLLLIDTREKLFYLIVTIAVSFALLTLKGGYWALLSGFTDRVYGPPGSQFYDNNQFAVVATMNIPLLLLWYRQVDSKRLRWVLLGAVALSVVAVLSSWSRGGLVALVVMALFQFGQSRRKLIVIPILVLSLALAWAALPEKWFARMETVATWQQDASALGRLRAWDAGASYALRHPYTGGGFDGWRHVTQGEIDWHSSYVEILAEHGVLGFVLWSALLLGSLVKLGRLGKGRGAPAWVVDYGLALRASLAAYAAGALFLGITYWDLLFHLIVISVLVSAIHAREIALTSLRSPLSAT
jgi:putative inorganic carbon (hco3(-)) transporter